MPIRKRALEPHYRGNEHPIVGLAPPKPIGMKPSKLQRGVTNGASFAKFQCNFEGLFVSAPKNRIIAESAIR